MTNKFEQLIEYVINDDAEKAKALFHDIVVEKSREIYENLMNEESDAEEDDKAEEAGKKVAKDIEYDDKKDRTDEGSECDDEELEEDMSSEASDDLIDDVEAEEEGMYEAGEEDESKAEFDDEAEEAGDEVTHDIEGEGDIEDRVVDLEDKLDELMAEFEALMGTEEAEHGEMDAEFDDVGGHDIGGDSLEMDDTAEFTQAPLGENISLPAAPKPVTAEPAGTNTKSTTAFNSGAAGMASKPVKATGATESNPDGTAAYKQPSNAYSKGEGNLPGAGSFKNVPAKDGSKLAAAPKPVTSQAAGVNTKTPFPKA